MMTYVLYGVSALIAAPLIAKGTMAYLDEAFRWFAERNGY
jgi:hypothetical protein